METRKKDLSIRLTYWITNIAFWFFILGAVFSLGIALALLFDVFTGDLNLHVGLPVSFDLTESGKLFLRNNSIEVGFSEAYGKLEFSELPPFIGRIYGVFMILVIGTFFYIFKTFRTFTKNLYRGITFEASNFELLRKIAFGILFFWVLMVSYSVTQYFVIATHLEFESLVLSGSIQYYVGIVFVALFLLMLSQVFQQGAMLEEDNQLTI